MPGLETYRAEEFSKVAGYFQPGAQILEIGDRNGSLASLIAALGVTVESIDVARPRKAA